MPEMDGYEVAKKLREKTGMERTMLAAMTGWGQEDDRLRSQDAGFDFHLVKPLEPAALQMLLRNFADSK